MKQLKGCVFWFFAVLLAGGAEPSSVVLNVSTDRKYYSNWTEEGLFFQVTIDTAMESEGGQPGRRNIALVVDRSSSMTGEFIAGARSAVLTGIEVLSPDDLVSLVVFGSEVETVVREQRVGDIRNPLSLVEGIEPAGGTALYDALNQAAALLRRNRGAGTINHLLLICDGKPNKGPREMEDFFTLADVFVSEGVTASAVGLGHDFDEDLLTGFARRAGGRFLYAPGGVELSETVKTDLGHSRVKIGAEAELELSLSRMVRKVESVGWKKGIVDHRTVVWRIPVLMSGQHLVFAASAELDGFNRRFGMADVASARLRWTDPEGVAHEVEAAAEPIRFTGDADFIRESSRPEVMRTVAAQIISEAMQKAIERLDKGKEKSAYRALRAARNRVHWLNDELEDAEIDALTADLDVYLEKVKELGMSELDRKILRSGLFNRVEPPTDDEEED